MVGFGTCPFNPGLLSWAKHWLKRNFLDHFDLSQSFLVLLSFFYQKERKKNLLSFIYWYYSSNCHILATDYRLDSLPSGWHVNTSFILISTLWSKHYAHVIDKKMKIQWDSIICPKLGEQTKIYWILWLLSLFTSILLYGVNN